MPFISLEEIAKDNDVVFLDTNIIAYSMNELYKRRSSSRHYFEEDNPLKIEEVAENFGYLLSVVKKYPNICSIKQLNDELKELVKISKESKVKKRKEKKKVETFVRTSSFDRDLLTLKNASYSQLNPTLELLKNIKTRLRPRTLKFDSQEYKSLFNLCLIVAGNIHLFSDDSRHALENQRNRTRDETIVASAFAYAYDGRGSVAIVSSDTRIPPLIKGMYEFIFSENSSRPIERKNNLAKFLVSVYQREPEKYKNFVEAPIEFHQRLRAIRERMVI